MSEPLDNEAGAVPEGYFRAKSGTLCKLPNRARSGADVALGAPHGTATYFRALNVRQAKPTRSTLKKLAEAQEKAVAANLPGTSEAQVRRAKAKVDRTYLIPVQSIEEYASMLRLVLTNDGGSMDAPYRHAIESVAVGLSAMCVEGFDT